VHSFIDISGGAGGLALGLEDAGFSPLLVVEANPDARETIRANRNWPVEPVMSEFLAEGLASQRVTLLAGNVSSAGISVAGVSQESDASVVYMQILGLIQRVRPTAVLLINVAGLMSARFAKLRSEIDEILVEDGYRPAWSVLDSADYGLAQSRRRAVLVAIQADAFSRFVWPAPIGPPPSVGETLLPFMSANSWPGAKQWARLARGVAPTIVGGSKLHGGADLGPSRTKNIWYSLGVDGRGIAEKPPSLETPKRASPRLTNPMLAALQGFPDSWIFEGKKTSVYRQIAGAFPPPTAAAIGRELMEALIRV
jgi:DNA (cytosine-5)-methyltransferase 1